MKTDIRKVFVACNGCGSTDATCIAIGRDREYASTTTDVFTVVRCGACGLAYLNPRPDVSELPVIYPPSYHAYNIRPRDSDRVRKPWITRLRHRLYRRRFQRPLSYLAGRSTIDLLDVGCGDGWMLDLYRLAAPGRMHTYGVDFNADACAAARASGHTVFCGRFEELELPRSFDLVNLSHVIEHVADPRGFVARVADVLRPGGLLVLETPNTETPEWRWFGSGAWGAYHIPRHWTFYDPESIRLLGASAGFALLELAFHPAPVHWIWTGHNLALEHRGLIGRIGRWLFDPLAAFRGGARAAVLLAVFSALDLVLKTASGRTSNMMAVFRKES